MQTNKPVTKKDLLQLPKLLRQQQMSRIDFKTIFSEVLRELNDFGYTVYKLSGYTAKKLMTAMLVFHEMDSPLSHFWDRPSP